jgi:hypothetical protein
MLHAFICIISTRFDITLCRSGIGFGWNGGRRLSIKYFSYCDAVRVPCNSVTHTQFHYQLVTQDWNLCCAMFYVHSNIKYRRIFNIIIAHIIGIEIFMYFFLLLYLFIFTYMNDVHTNSRLYNMNCSINGSSKVLSAQCWTTLFPRIVTVTLMADQLHRRWW